MKKSVLLAVSILIIATLACGSSNTGVSIPTAVGASSTSVPTSPPKTFVVGDLVKVQDHTIILNSAPISSAGILKANFTVENKGTESLAVSTMVSFEAKDSEGVKLDQDFFDCGSSFDGSVLPGDKLKGDICWKTTTAPPFKIYYKANFLSEGAIVWVITP